MIISTKETCSGEPRIDGHRITVKNILSHMFETKEGKELILSQYPDLTEEDIKDTKKFLFELVSSKIDSSPISSKPESTFDMVLRTLLEVKESNPTTYMNKSIVVEVDGTGIGGTPCVPVEHIHTGFDWDDNKIILKTQPLCRVQR